MPQTRRLTLAATLALGASTSLPTAATSAPPSDSFNDYILKAVERLMAQRGGLGYDINSVLTQNMQYGNEAIQATNPPLSMCVAAMIEIIVTAFQIYAEDKRSQEIYSYLPASSWSRLRPADIKSHIWVDPRLRAYGTADALYFFGIGARAAFSSLTPGSFINFNRNIPGKRPSGHAVIFLGYLDKEGRIQNSFGANVVGFKYFSANGQYLQPPHSGFGYRYAFFAGRNGGLCPNLGNNRITDCGITYSLDQRSLNTGYMLEPRYWDASKRDQNITDLKSRLLAETRTRGPGFLGMPGDVSDEDFERGLQVDTMQLNTLYEENPA